MIRAGQKATFPKLLFIENRMKIERLIEEGLFLGNENELVNDKASGRGRKSPNRHAHTLRTSTTIAVRSSSDEPRIFATANRRTSTLQELNRQSTVFFDDTEGDDEEVDKSDEGMSTI